MDVLGSVLKITLGLFIDKARHKLCEKLQDGGLNSQKLCKLIMSNIDNMKSKLDGLSRAPLLSSASSINEGLQLLNEFMERNSYDSEIVESLSTKRAKALKKLRAESTDYFQTITQSFANANHKATDAFFNSALSIEDRILATKLRVQSRLLLSILSPRLACMPCKTYLEELHGLSEVTGSLRALVKGGILSKLYQTKSREIASNVSIINFVVLAFFQRFLPPTSIDSIKWPCIQLDDITKYIPLFPHKEIITRVQDAGVSMPNLITVQTCDSPLKYVGMKRNGSIIAHDEDKIVEICLTGDHRNFYQLNEYTNLRETCFSAMVDSEDIVYLLVGEHQSSGIMSDPNYLCTLKMISSNGKLIKDAHFTTYGRHLVKMKAAKNGFILTEPWEDCHSISYYKINNKKKIKCTSTFKISRRNILTALTDNNDLVVAEYAHHVIKVYNSQGDLQREFELYGGENEGCASIEFNHSTKEVVFLSFVDNTYYLSTYSLDSGKRKQKEKIYLFSSNKKKSVLEEGPSLVSNCFGRMAVVTSDYILHIP